MKNIFYGLKRYQQRLCRLSKKCRYYHSDVSNHEYKLHKAAYDIEYRWASDLAISFKNADKIKAEMKKTSPMEFWSYWATKYNLPLSLVGYIFKYTAGSGMFMHERVGPFIEFLKKHYS